jgi:hypothetical protein
VITTIAGVEGDRSQLGTRLGTSPRFNSPHGLAILGDSLVITDANAVLLLSHVVF